MTNTAVRNISTIETTEIIRNQIEEKAETENPYNLTLAMNARLYL